MLETIKSAIYDAEQAEPFSEFYQSYVAHTQDHIIEQEIQHIANLITSNDDKISIYSQIDEITQEVLKW